MALPIHQLGDLRLAAAVLLNNSSLSQHRSRGNGKVNLQNMTCVGRILTQPKVDPSHSSTVLPPVDTKTVTIIDVSGATSSCKPSFSAIKVALDDAFVTPVYLPDGGVLLVDEDGLPKGLAPNLEASRLANQMLVGKVAYVPKALVKKVLG